MFTAQNAKSLSYDDLDARIEKAVKEAISCGHKSASIRVYIEDSYVHTISMQLKKRGFTDIHVPDICLEGDVSFSWEGQGMLIDNLLPHDWQNPNWECRTKVYEWKNYVETTFLEDMWNTFDDNQKKVLAYNFQLIADNEEWV